MKALLVLVVVVVLAAVGIDRLALHIAESQAADKIKAQQKLSSTPHVKLDGFPFLTQLISGHFDGGSVTMAGVGTDGTQSVRIDQLTAHASDIRTSNNFSRVTLGTVTGTALIKYSDLSQAMGADLSYGGTTAGGQGRVKLSGSVKVLGQTLTGSAAAQVVLSGVNRLGFSFIQVEGINVPQPVAAGLNAFAAKDLTVNGMPTGLTLRSIQARPDGVVATVTGADVTLAR